MNITQSLAAGAYDAARTATTPRPGTGEGAVSRAASSFARTLAAGEQTALASMRGADDPHLLVTALAQTELAVETAVTIRNRMVEAYQEILRMPV